MVNGSKFLLSEVKQKRKKQTTDVTSNEKKVFALFKQNIKSYNIHTLTSKVHPKNVNANSETSMVYSYITVRKKAG